MKFNVERSTTINADLATVKSHILDFNKWNGWSPWTIAEPDCPITPEGTPGEVGHAMSWDGKIIGAGKNTLTKKEDHRLDYHLDFFTPYKSQAESFFTFKEQGGSTEVTWGLESSMPFFLFFMIPKMKAWIGMDYDRGLRMLKEVCEKGSVNATTSNKGVVDLDGFSYVGIKRTVPMSDIGPTMIEDFKTIINDVVKKRGIAAQHWVSLYPKMDMKNMQMTYIAAVSDENLKDVDLGSQYERGTVASGKALEILHEGSYDFLGNAWSMGMMYLQANKNTIKQGDIPFEYYRNSPMEVAPEELKTSIYFPLK